ncbi:MAG TPA: hypothetical protein VJ874_03885 [Candidatus Thermoplasmatota archaeon]|nr:hypothetical protein [Candidatus Thermoplasmatota archaeon]
MVKVIKVKGPVVLEFPDGTRVRIDPAERKAERPKGKPGRPVSPATLKLRAAMQRDHADGSMRGRDHYLGILRKGGHKGGGASAYVILNREAKLAFGRSLGRQKGLKRKANGGGKRGRRAAPETILLREKLAADKAAGNLRDAKHYLTWLMDQPGSKLGIKPARPIVYRELRAVKA